jgi:hypothetical protein
VNITPKLPRQTVFESLWKAKPTRGPKFFQYVFTGEEQLQVFVPLPAN